MKFIKPLVIMFLTFVVLIGTQAIANTEIEQEIDEYIVKPCLVHIARNAGLSKSLSDEETLNWVESIRPDMNENLRESTVLLYKTFELNHATIYQESFDTLDKRMTIYEEIRDICITGEY